MRTKFSQSQLIRYLTTKFPAKAIKTDFFYENKNIREDFL